MAALRAVVEAKRLLEETQAWAPWSWALVENKCRVRAVIENATAALDREIAKVKGNRDQRESKVLRDAEAEFKQATTRAKKMFNEAEEEWNAGKARQGAILALKAIEKHEIVLGLAKGRLWRVD
jgi:hypothetical protein